MTTLSLNQPPTLSLDQSLRKKLNAFLSPLDLCQPSTTGKSVGIPQATITALKTQWLHVPILTSIATGQGQPLLPALAIRSDMRDWFHQEAFIEVGWIAWRPRNSVPVLALTYHGHMIFPRLIASKPPLGYVCLNPRAREHFPLLWKMTNSSTLPFYIFSTDLNDVALRHVPLPEKKRRQFRRELQRLVGHGSVNELAFAKAVERFHRRFPTNVWPLAWKKEEQILSKKCRFRLSFQDWRKYTPRVSGKGIVTIPPSARKRLALARAVAGVVEAGEVS